mmetsp:Transcript_12771/g.24611  ORF Transcript_12771/g.24611 Transcript_12771/m.24611 type:complete len:1085 (+) Transcript_12771:101-3355(+)
MTSLAGIFGDSLLSQDGPVNTSQSLENKTVGIYFVARDSEFTPDLIKTYRACKGNKNVNGNKWNFEVVLVSADLEQADFDANFATMPWLAVPFTDRDRMSDLIKTYEGAETPKLVLLDSSGSVITNEGVASVLNDPYAANFPWPKVEESQESEKESKEEIETPEASASKAHNAKIQELLEFEPKVVQFEPQLLEPMSLVETANAEILAAFHEDYQKLQHSLRMSAKNENKFFDTCKKLMAEISKSSRSLTTLTWYLAQDLSKKEKLKEDIKEHRQAKLLYQAEVNAKKLEIEELELEKKRLEKEVLESSNESIREQKRVINDLEIERNKYISSNEKERAELKKIREKSVELYKNLEDVKALQAKGQDELDTLDRKIRETEALSAKEKRRKQELERQMKTLSGVVAERMEQIQIKKQYLEKSRSELQQVEISLAKAEQAVEESREEQDKSRLEATSLNGYLSLAQEENEERLKSLRKAQKELDERIQHAKQTKINTDNKKKALDIIRHKVKMVEAETREADQVKQEWQKKMKEMKDEITAMQSKLNNNSKQMDTCVREREVLSQNHMARIEQIRDKENSLKIKRSTLKNIKNEHQGYLVSIRNLTKIIEALKRDKAVHEADLNKRQVQKARALEEVTERELKIGQFQSQILVNESKLRQQQNLLEAVRSDRNLYRKTLIEQKNEMQEFKRKYTNLNNQIKQLKQEIAEKDIGFVTEHFNLEHVRADIHALKAQNDSTKAQTVVMDEVIKNQGHQIRKLTTIIADADEELRVQQKQYNAIVNEQRVLNQQLIKRNDELANLYEQLRLQNSVLSKGASAYEDKKSILAQFTASRDALVNTLDEIMNDVGKYDELKVTIGSLQKELIEEQLKTKALMDELKKPINIHRWRRLMDTNTDTYGMIKRVRNLQKAIINKSAQVDAKDGAIQEKEKLYVDLRKVLARQPGSEAAEQLRLYAATLRDKKSKFKQMKAELKMYQAKVYEYKYELQKLTQDLHLVKLEYFSRRRRELAQGRESLSRDSARPGSMGSDAFNHGYVPNGEVEGQDQGFAASHGMNGNMGGGNVNSGDTGEAPFRADGGGGADEGFTS